MQQLKTAGIGLWTRDGIDKFNIMLMIVPVVFAALDAYRTVALVSLPMFLVSQYLLYQSICLFIFSMFYLYFKMHASRHRLVIILIMIALFSYGVYSRWTTF